MVDSFVNIKNWLIRQFEPIAQFLIAHRNSPFLWIGLFLLGMLIFKLTYDALTRGKEQ